MVASRASSELEVMPDNVKLWGRAKTQEELAQLYSEADMTLLLSRRETFSMVTAESLCCGTPVVGFKAGGPESIAIPTASSFVEYGDIDALINQLRKETSQISNNDFSEEAQSSYGSKSMSCEYMRVYRQLCNQTS